DAPQAGGSDRSPGTDAKTTARSGGGCRSNPQAGGYAGVGTGADTARPLRAAGCVRANTPQPVRDGVEAVADPEAGVRSPVQARAAAGHDLDPGGPNL